MGTLGGIVALAIVLPGIVSFCILIGLSIIGAYQSFVGEGREDRASEIGRGFGYLIYVGVLGAAILLVLVLLVLGLAT